MTGTSLKQTSAGIPLHPDVKAWVEMVEAAACGHAEGYRVCADQVKLVSLVKASFAHEDVYVDEEQWGKYKRLQRYFGYQFTPWENFCAVLFLCTYVHDSLPGSHILIGQNANLPNRDSFVQRDATGKPVGWVYGGMGLGWMPRWPDMLQMISRGNGKDGEIAYHSMCLTSPYNPVPDYDVDICANNETQGLRPVHDLVGVLKTTENAAKLAKSWRTWTDRVQGTRNGGYMTGYTNNPSGRDGLRTGCVVLNEIHQYLNRDNVKVFLSGLGKHAQPRSLFVSSNGDVSEGFLDEELSDGQDVLDGNAPDYGKLYFICRLDDPQEVHDPINWSKANPSIIPLPQLQPDGITVIACPMPALMLELYKQYREWKKDPGRASDFMTKRMGIRMSAKVMPVADWPLICETNKALPLYRDGTGYFPAFGHDWRWTMNAEPEAWPMEGRSCTAGLDFASFNDWAAVTLHFRIGDRRIDITHAWLCLQSKTLANIKAPWREWADAGMVTPVDAVEIPPSLITAWISNVQKHYNIVWLCLDNFRYAVIKAELVKIGFEEKRNLYLYRPSDVMRIVPVIDRCFDNGWYTWADNPMLRWACNNAKKVASGKRLGTDTGNFYYAKIEAKSRKTDPWMATVAAQIKEDALEELDTPAILPDVGPMFF